MQAVRTAPNQNSEHGQHGWEEHLMLKELTPS